MGCRRLLALIVTACATIAAGPPTQPAALPWELSANVRAALDATEDFALNFDQPGFYAVVAAVKHSPHSPGHTQEPLVVEDWRSLLERPSDFRGRAITLEGQVGRNKTPYVLNRLREVGPVGQIELYRDDQPLAVTAICTGDVQDVPLDATIRMTGYFVMIRQYHGTRRMQQAALIVTPGPTMISRPAPQVGGGLAGRWLFLLLAVGVGLLLAVLLIRHTRGPRRDVRRLHSRGPAPVNLAEDLEAWSSTEQRDGH